MIGEFGFHLVGCGSGGFRLLTTAITKQPDCALGESFGRILTGRSTSPSENEPDPVERAKLRIDRFQTACWLEAGKQPGRKWGHLTLTEQIGSLLESSGTDPQQIDFSRKAGADAFDPVDYFICRNLEVPTIILLRDGRDCIPAKVKNEKIPAATAVAQWRHAVHTMKRFVFFNKDCLVIRLEDMMAQPKDVVGELCQFLRVRFDKGMIAHLLEMKKTDGWRYNRADLAKRVAKENWIGGIQQDLRDCGYLD